jgi:aldehyde dehydrogenase (NAD+)
MLDQSTISKLKSRELLSFTDRKNLLLRLKSAIKNHEDQLLEALSLDLGKSSFEAFASEIGFIYGEINHALKHLKRWMKPKKVQTPLVHWPSSSHIYSVPHGLVLIIGPWNYPFQLLFAPLVAAIAGGNRVVLKPSEMAEKTAEVIESLVKELGEEYISVVQGEGHIVVPKLMEEDFDYVFFTGSVPVGRIIGEMAAKRHIPFTLELGGKSPGIIHKDADLDVAAKRIAYGKTINAGQTCVAPDYLLIHQEVWDAFLKKLSTAMSEFFQGNALEHQDFGTIINRRRYTILKGFLDQGTIYSGGKFDDEKLAIEPTILTDVAPDAPIMSEEIFGPILPVFSYSDFSEVHDFIAKNPKPLALYLFTGDGTLENQIIQSVPFGGGCVNNTLMHLLNPDLPFGGVGPSGSGNYHGEFGFITMTHQKAMVKTPTWFDLKLKYPPYTEAGYKMIRRLFK